MIRALAHPVRIALLEALVREGPLTATEAAELLADSPGNMSWHLQTLAKYGFVEEADGGVGRRRPWRRVAIGTEYEESGDDPELSIAATTLSEIGSETRVRAAHVIGMRFAAATHRSGSTRGS